MKKALTITVTVCALMAITSAFAGPACCPASKAAAKKASGEYACGMKDDCFAGLKLTTEQKASIKTLSTECSETKCSVTSKKKMDAGLKRILTAEQLKTLSVNCEKKGCPLTVAKDG